MKTSATQLPEAHDLYRALKDMMIVSELPVIWGRFTIDEHFVLDRLSGKLNLPENYRACAIYLPVVDQRKQLIVNEEGVKFFFIPLETFHTGDDETLDPFALYETCSNNFSLRVVSGGWVYFASPDIPHIVRKEA